jgi:hypothetical protein
MNCPPSANMFMIRAPFPRAIGTDFSGVLESIGSTEGRVHPHGAYVLAQGNIALDLQRFVEASGSGQGELTIAPARISDWRRRASRKMTKNDKDNSHRRGDTGAIGGT